MIKCITVQAQGEGAVRWKTIKTPSTLCENCCEQARVGEWWWYVDFFLYFLFGNSGRVEGYDMWWALVSGFTRFLSRTICVYFFFCCCSTGLNSIIHTKIYSRANAKHIFFFWDNIHNSAQHYIYMTKRWTFRPQAFDGFLFISYGFCVLAKAMIILYGWIVFFLCENVWWGVWFLLNFYNRKGGDCGQLNTMVRKHNSA